MRRGYRALAGADPQRWVTIDGTPPPDEVEAAVWEAVATRLPDLARATGPVPGHGGGPGGAGRGTADEARD